MFYKENTHSQDYIQQIVQQLQKMVVVGVIAMIWLTFNMDAHADSIHDSINSITNIAGMGPQDEKSEGNALSDQALSSVSGKGVDAQHNSPENQLAVILWDERGNNNGRQSYSLADGRGNLQTINITVSRE